MNTAYVLLSNGYADWEPASALAEPTTGHRDLRETLLAWHARLTEDQLNFELNRRLTGKPEVIGSTVGLVPTNALVLT